MHRQNDKMEDLRSSSDQNGETPTHAEGQNEEQMANQATLLKKDFAWCVVQTDRVNFQLKNALWGVALGKAGDQDGHSVAALVGSGDSSNAVEKVADAAVLISQVGTSLCTQNLILYACTKMRTLAAHSLALYRLR